MGRFKAIRAITSSIDNVTEIGKELSLDKDQALKLEHELQSMRASLLMGGVGASVTKITICGLVTLLVVIACLKFWFVPADMEHFKTLALNVTPILGLLIGAYGTGSIILKRGRNTDGSDRRRKKLH